MIYRLIILSGDRRGEQITLTRDPMVIGRAETCEIRLNDPEIALSHAEITHTDDGLFIRDLGSMNRLLINHREVHEARPKHGDVIEVGHTRFLIQAYVQAEVQHEIDDADQEEKANRRKPWIFALLMLVIFMLFFIPRCERYILAPRAPREKLSTAKLLPPTTTIEITRTIPPPLMPPAHDPVVAPSVVTQAPSEPVAEPVAAEPIKPAPEPLPGPIPVRVTSRTVPDISPKPPRAPKPNPTSDLIAASEKELQEAELTLKGSRTPNLTSMAILVETSAIPKAVTIVPPALITSNLIKIAGTDINKFPETDQFREMRLLTIRLTATESRRELDPEAVRVDVIFVNKDLITGELIPSSPPEKPANLAIQGKWRATEQKSVAASYVVPTTQSPTIRTSQYYGFHIGVYYDGILQDELNQPRDLPGTSGLTSREASTPPAP